MKIATQAVVQPKEFDRRTKEVSGFFYTSGMGQFYKMDQVFPVVEDRQVVKNACLEVWMENKRKPAAKATATKPKFIVIDGVFYAQTSDQGEVRIPLKFKTKLFRAITAITDEVEQVFALLDGIGDKKTADQLDELDIFEMQELVAAFFDEFKAKAEASVGESKGSSDA